MKYKSVQKFDLFFFVVTVVLILIFAVFAKAQNSEISAPEVIVSGGAFTLEKAVVAGGGSAKQGAALGEHGTTGQSIAGIKSNGGQFSLYSGFWTPEELVPTAASVNVGGRIKTAAGKGIRNVKITVTFPTGETRTAISGAGGFYQLADTPAGETYIFSASAKHYVFTQPTQVRTVNEDTDDVDFIAVQSKSPKNELPLP